ncbi:MAG: hypothetical protein QW201_00815 [Thermoproteota archaeon]
MYRPPGVEDELKRLISEKKRLEESFEDLQKLFKSGKISEQEYNERRRSIEREFVEVMDRLVQIRFIAGEEQE